MKGLLPAFLLALVLVVTASVVAQGRPTRPAGDFDEAAFLLMRNFAVEGHITAMSGAEDKSPWIEVATDSIWLGMIPQMSIRLGGAQEARYWLDRGIRVGDHVIAYGSEWPDSSDLMRGNIMVVHDDGSVGTHQDGGDPVLFCGDMPMTEPTAYRCLKEAVRLRSRLHPAEWFNGAPGVLSLRVTSVLQDNRLAVVPYSPAEDSTSLREIVLRPSIPCPYAPDVGDVIVIPRVAERGQATMVIDVCLYRLRVDRLGQVPAFGVGVAEVGSRFQTTRSGRLQLIRIWQ